MMPGRRFVPLEQSAFLSLEQAPSLKGLLRPFKGKGSLETWASQCLTLRDGLIELVQREVLTQARAHPFNRLDVQLAQQTTGAGTAFLRWRKPDRSVMGVRLWQELIARPSLSASLLDDLYAMEQQRVVLNLQVSLLHTLTRQARDCAGKLGRAEAVYLRQLERRNAR
jgi:hypothetical protein